MGARVRSLAVSLGVLSLWMAAPRARAGDVPWRAHPELADRIAPVRVVGIARPEVKAFELTAGGNRVFRPDWSDQAADALAAAVAARLGARGFEPRPFTLAAGMEEEMRGVKLLYDAVASAVLQATYVEAFPAKLARFEFTLGDLAPLLAPQGVDAVVFVDGVANISSPGRKALQVVAAVLGPAYSVGLDHVLIAVVDRSGAVLWFGKGTSSDFDLRDARSAGSFLGPLVDDLPAVSR